MFGMLDYRAHKLFWLLYFPLRIAGKIALWAMIVVAILIVHSFSYSWPVKAVLGYVIFEAMGIGVTIIFAALSWLLSKSFFSLIDVVPTKGEDAEEARLVVTKGPLFWLSKKMSSNIDDWTDDDTDAFAKALNWRARLLFNERKKIQRRAEIFLRNFEETGIQPVDLPRNELKDLVGHLDGSKLARGFEIAIVNPNYFSGIVGLVVIVIAMAYLH
jgi:hypothetical protein